ncbi:MAG: hypothetical protein BWK78_00720 [Thiotrichaceae bacterium IS1]|nr:MAG: hypothetical protein BWK78_00720 [Thiotrichaceae bacterium IS1]
MQKDNNPLMMKFDLVNAVPLGKDGFFLRRVRTNNSLLCGGRIDLPGFGSLDDKGRNVGFDIDLCRAVAAAVLNSPTGAIKFVLTSTEDRCKVLQQAEVDMLSRNMTWTTTRDAECGDFTWIMFYDGQGFMVRKDSNITQSADLNGKAICVVNNTTSKANLEDFCKKAGLTCELVTAEETSELFPMYDRGECDAITTDKSGLAAKFQSLSDPNAHSILNFTISKEPLSPAVPHGDDQWSDIVKTVLFGLITAEELGITQANVDAKMNDTDPQVRRLLGLEGSFGQELLGLEKGAIAQAIRAVGNYGEIYNRYFAADKLNLPRQKSPNELVTNGGQIYAPPLR